MKITIDKTEIRKDRTIVVEDGPRLKDLSDRFYTLDTLELRSFSEAPASSVLVSGVLTDSRTARSYNRYATSVPAAERTGFELAPKEILNLLAAQQ